VRLLADRTVRPNALVTVSILGYKGVLQVCTMRDPVCDLIIGHHWNERSVEKENDEDENYAVNERTLIFENTKHEEPLSDVLPSQEKCSKAEVIDDKTEVVLVPSQDLRWEIRTEMKLN